MTLEETRQMLTVLKASYPNSYRNMSNEESFNYLNLWAKAFEDDDTQTVSNAIHEIIYSDTSSFAPTIAQVKDKMKAMANVLLIDRQEHIMRKYDPNYEDGNEYDKDSMMCYFFSNRLNVPIDEVKEDFKNYIGMDYDDYVRDLKKQLIPLLRKFTKEYTR